MDLLLWRHAEAEDGLPDLARPLTAKGRRQAKEMADWLRTRLGTEARILVSPAVRAQQTAAVLKREFETVAAIAPGASPEAILTAAGWPAESGTALLVGHQPGLGLSAALLLFGEACEFSIRKGGLVWISGRARVGGPQGVLKAAISPEML